MNCIDAQERESSEGSVLQRLDAILDRLTAIEARLSKLEESQRSAGQWSVDELGVLRTAKGRQIGFWGVDIVPRTAVKR
jgi:hypothetical protein